MQDAVALPLDIVLALPDEAATARLGAALATLVLPGDVITLSGPLGSGKTTLARALIRAMNPDEDIGAIPSPSFALVLLYPCDQAILWHFDLYRLQHADEVLELGLDEALESGISLIEWPQRLGTMTLPDCLAITLTIPDNAATSTMRQARLLGTTRWAACHCWDSVLPEPRVGLVS